MSNQCRLRLAAKGVDFGKLPDEQKFVQRCREIQRELKNYWLRVEYHSKANIRYMRVGERHKSGLPHFHAVVHEASSDWPVRARVLEEQWPLGFVSCKLVAQGEGNDATSYVAKYLAKEALVRVGASPGYGDAD